MQVIKHADMMILSFGLFYFILLFPQDEATSLRSSGEARKRYVAYGV